MIALIAALEAETEPMRETLAAEVSLPGGYSCFRGEIGRQEVVLLHCGIGKANAAAATATLLAREPVGLIINFGCGGAYPGSDLRPGDIAVADRENALDEGSDSPDGFLDLQQLAIPQLTQGPEQYFNTLPIAKDLMERIRPQLERSAATIPARLGCGPFATVSTCTGTDQQGKIRRETSAAICENMEGAAIALVACRYRIPWLELRGISNLAAARDRDSWQLPLALKNVNFVLRQLLQNWQEDWL